MADKSSSVAIPPLDDFLKAGAHFGHRVSRWNPKMDDYIYTTRNGVHIIDLVLTMKLLDDALDALKKYSDQGSVLLVGTKGQASSMVQRVAEESGAFYINTRWPGGLFTNFKMINKSVGNLIKMEEQLAGGAEDLVKKEQLLLARDVGRLNRLYEGIKFMDKLPSAVIVIDSRLEKIAIKEAQNAGVPVIGLIDTNCDPELVNHPIPANDDSIKSIEMFLNLFGEVIKTGKSSNRVISLRNDHNAKLEKLANEYAAKISLKEKQEEEERERMKRLRSGGVIEDDKTSNVVRIVKKENVDKSTTTAKPKAKAKSKATPKAKAKTKPATTDKKPISELGLSNRALNALEAGGYKSTKDLAGLTKSDLTNIKGIGAVAADEILASLK